MRTPRIILACCSALLAAGACTATSGAGSTSTPTNPAISSSARNSTSPSGSGTAHTTSGGTGSGTPARPADAPGPALRALDRMSLAQKVGQLIMVDCPSSGVAAATSAAVRRHFVGSVILDGNSTLGVRRTRAITDRLQRLAPAGTKLFISTDQEGGLVQRMRGPGFSTIPSAVVQGTWSPARVRSFAHKWGTELRAAGINVDLAPVLDTVPPGTVSNPPIGDLDREYGRTPRAVRAHGVAAAQGLADAGIAATVKHFPGLGRVTGNTDTTSGVTDTRTVRHDAYLGPFAAAVMQHVPFVMVSTAIYSRIAPGTPAVFSPTVVTGMLRHDLGFHGVIITDDVGIATQVSGYSPAQRAVRFIGAGGTIVLTVDPHVVPAMTSALIARARHSAAFKRKIDAAALVVLRAKRARGLLG